MIGMMLSVAILLATAPIIKVQVVNMIPAVLSDEVNQDSEPHLAVNPTNPNQMAASAFTPDPLGGPNAPIFVSNDGGRTWSMNSILPSFRQTADVTLAFSANRLYASVLRREENSDPQQRMPPMVLLRTDSFLQPNVMTTFFTSEGPDQPFIQAERLGDKDRLFIGGNDVGHAPRTARVFRSLDSAGSTVTVDTLIPELRDPDPQDGPQVRTAVSSDGTVVYGIFYRWKSFTDDGMVSADVTLVKDDFSGSPFSLLRAKDSINGVFVSQDVTLRFVAAEPVMGQERVGGDLAIIVDPRQRNTIYLAFSDFDTATQRTVLHLRRSADGGVSFTPDLATLNGAKNPALAITSNGVIGFLYQQLIGSGTKEKWTTVFETSTNGDSFTKAVLAIAPSSIPSVRTLPYLGDYLHLVAVGSDFFGVFSFANTPDSTHFPFGVTYARKADFATKTLHGLSGGTVRASIDPFFFHVSTK